MKDDRTNHWDDLELTLNKNKTDLSIIFKNIYLVKKIEYWYYRVTQNGIIPTNKT